ncbi:unnamed protein product, partial [Nesidiocoris tenuis]
SVKTAQKMTHQPRWTKLKVQKKRLFAIGGVLDTTSQEASRPSSLIYIGGPIMLPKSRHRHNPEGFSNNEARFHKSDQQAPI